MVGECETTKKRLFSYQNVLWTHFASCRRRIAAPWVKTESVTKVMQVHVRSPQIHFYLNPNSFYLFGFLCLTMNDFYFRIGIQRNLLLWGSGRGGYRRTIRGYLRAISGPLGRSWSFRRSGPGRFWRSLGSTLNQRIKIINGSTCCCSPRATLFRHWANKDFLDCFYFHLRRSLGHKFGSCGCGSWWRWTLWSGFLTVFPFTAFSCWKGSKG